MITVRTAKDYDLRLVLRRSPLAGLLGAKETLDECMQRSSQIWHGLVDGEIACAWGLIPPTILSDHAYLWLLTTDIVAEHKFLFIRHSQRCVEETLRLYPSIIGDTDVHNTSAIRWLRWLGARFYDPIDGKLPFTIEKKK